MSTTAAPSLGAFAPWTDAGGVVRRSSIAVGWVRHRRFTPRGHAFRYPIALVCVELSEAHAVLSCPPWCAHGSTGLARFRRDDYHHDDADHADLADAVRATIANRIGRRPDGPIFLITQLRQFGYCFNPVSFYLATDADATRLDAVMAEVTNTPWGERHAYAFDAAADHHADASPRAGHATLRARFAKPFHVSPFNPMDQQLDWRFRIAGARTLIHMVNEASGAAVMDATLSLTHRPLTPAALRRALLTHPWQTAAVWARIHLQAARLWWKGVPSYTHPLKTGGIATAITDHRTAAGLRGSGAVLST